jgi:hypothetical protein
MEQFSSLSWSLPFYREEENCSSLFLVSGAELVVIVTCVVYFLRRQTIFG